MSWSLENLSRDQREAIARGLFDVREERGDELTGCCPIHGETGVKSFSFGYNLVKDGYKCFACGETGDLITLYGKRHSYDTKDAYRHFTAAYGNGSPVSTKSAPLPPLPGGASPVGGAGEGSEVYLDESILSDLAPLPGNWVRSCVDKFTWSPETIKALDIRLWKNGAEERIAIPVRDNGGRLRNVRLYRPGAANNKLRSWSKGSGSNRLYPPPSIWSDGPLLICEGEKDCISALSHGFNAVTQTCGVTSWHDSFTPLFKGREVVIAYDADDAGRTGAAKLARKLAKTAKRVKVIVWPSFMADKQDLTDWFGVHHRTAEDLRALMVFADEPAVKQEKPAKTVRGAEIGEDTARFFIFNGRGWSFKPRLVVDEILASHKIVFDPETGKIYLWNGQYWGEYSETAIRKQVLTMLGNEATSSRSNDICSMVRDLSMRPHNRNFNDRENMLPLQNGMFCLDTFTVLPHDPEHLNTYCLAIRLDNDPAKLPLCPAFSGFMAQLIPDVATRREVLKYCGLSMTRNVKYEKALILIGPGGDGKSTLIKTVEHIIGEHNVSNLTIGALADQFQRVTLKDKLLNVATETEAGLLQSNMFKAVVSADRITAAFKFKDAFSFRPVAKHIYAANREPTVQDTTDGYFRRLIYVYVKKAFDKPDLDLQDKLKAESDAIFLMMLRHYQILLAEGFIETPYMKSCLGEYKEHLNPVISFAQFHLEFDTDQSTETIKVYKQYRKFCEIRGFSPKGEAQFGKELKAQYKIEKKRDSFRAECRRKYYTGVKIVDHSPTTELEEVEYG